MNKQRRLELSRFLSFVLRHKPEDIHIELDKMGWTDFKILASNILAKHSDATENVLLEIIENDKKSRFELSEGRIRASQGHSVDVNPVEGESCEPPEFLYHGTKQNFWESIQASGYISRGERHHVHLSEDFETAQRVAARRAGESVILTIRSRQMATEGFLFFRSSNGVWLTGSVPLKFVISRI